MAALAPAAARRRDHGGGCGEGGGGLSASLMVPLGLLLGFLSNQGEKSIHLCFIMVPLRNKVLKYGTPKPSL